MEIKNFSRRNFVKNSLYGLALTSLPSQLVFGQTVTKKRLEWQSFKQSADYSSYISAIRKMRANTNPNDKGSWLYWINAHVKYCPHGAPYFLAWHRGYLYYFEQQLRALSGNSTLMIPYWDYYTNPRIPAEFTSPSTNNPLYINRVNTNVFQALTLAPFSNQLTNFQRGTSNALEPSIEGGPHNPVHNIIGGYMADMQSPMDPIFWLHHGNIDRLWSAWVAAGNGRKMPANTASYWSGQFTYNTGLTLNRNRVINTTTYLGYNYQNETFPKVLPPQAQRARIIRVAMTDNMPNQGVPRRPRLGKFGLSGPGPRGKNRRSVGGVKEIPLDELSVSAQIPIEKPDSQTLRSIVGNLGKSPFSSSQPAAAGPYTSVQVILDNIRITDAGKSGGYYYDVYLNLPENGDALSSKEKYLLGSIGPFQIAGALHHGGGSASFVFPATQLLRGLTSEDISALTVSFVRVSGDNSPKGPVITVGDVRVEVSTDDIE